MKFEDLKVKKPNGEIINFSDFEGKPVLIINTATQCGLTPQFSGLEKIHQKYKDKGLVVLGFPCNQFGHQEPLSNEEMTATCEINHGVTFQLTAKIDVNGENEHEVYTWLKENSKSILGKKIKWNFGKFLVASNHKKVWRFAPTASPEKVSEKVEKIIDDHRP